MKAPPGTPFSRPRAEGGALIAVIALLCLLAVLQHQWLGAIAEAERRSLTETAKDKAEAIASDVDRELTRAFLELRIEARVVETMDGAAFARQFERWRRESPHAGLVKSVLVAQSASPGSGAPRLTRFDPDAKAFVEEAWPPFLDHVRVAFEGGGPELPGGPSLPPVMPDVPALVAPVMNILTSDGPADKDVTRRITQIREMFVRHEGRTPVQIVVLDTAYLTNRLVQGAAEERLGRTSPFLWSVMKGDGSWAAGEPRTDDRADSTASLLRLRFDDLDRSLLKGFLPGLATSPSSSVRMVVQMARPPSNGAHVLGAAKAIAPWMLYVRHREGSIDTAVRRQQWRNTALSGSILGVLGMSAGLVFLSARRLRAVATKQVEFVAAVSHELRTPLAVIRSAADNLADGVVQEAGQARRYGALIRDESVRLTDMVEHVLEFAGADSPGRAVRGPVDAGEAVRAAVQGMEALIRERAARVDVETPSETVRVNGDLSHLTRAVSNLLGNALKYGGAPAHVKIAMRRADEGVVISVADQGEGLAPAEIPRLFEPFYRGQRASEAQIPGSGLGLALVKRIVESHGGRVSALNGDEGGALFTIVLPAV